MLAAVGLLVALPASGAAARGRASHHRAPARSSLYTGSGSRPGPAILYAAPAAAPQLSNTGIWHAAPTLVSGAEAYRKGEFLYQDYLYDDHGAHGVADPTNPALGEAGNLFSMPNGTYTYPTGPGYADNAADLVEFRVKPLAKSTAFRITMNTLENQSLIAFSIAIGGTPGKTYPFPDGANVVAPARLFLTVRPVNGKLTAQLVRAGTDASVGGPAPAVKVEMRRRQIQVEVPHSEWNPRRSTVRFAMGVGLWNGATNHYLLPGAVASATTPGGGTATNPAAFFNVAFRTNEPLPSVEDSTNAVLDAAWWRDRAQGAALASGNISQLSAEVNFRKLARRVTDNSMIPRTGPIDMILASHYSLGQGENFAHPCGLSGSPDGGACSPEYLGQLQPYSIYVPKAPTPHGGWGLTLLLHSLSANYNQYTGSRNQSQFALRAHPSIVITPEARGPDQSYEGLGAADVFEVWAAVARLYRLDPAYTDITGYSMGGIGTFKLAEQFPDLFARAQPTVGAETGNNDLVTALRNVPVLMWNNAADELVGAELYEPTANALATDGYRYELDVYRPCASTLCSPLFPDHLELAVNDEFAPAAAFLGPATIDYNPAHVTYVVYPERSVAKYKLVADHAYWLSGLTLRSQTSSSAEAKIDAVSHGFGVGDPTPSSLKIGAGALTGGYMGPIQYASFAKTWGAVPTESAKDEIEISATNLATATVNVARAHVDCHVALKVTSDGPLTITLQGCNRVVHAG
jgi:dienelactone hydrolase